MPGNGDVPTVAGVPITIDKQSPVATYLQLAAEIERLITSGELKAGEAIPSYHELIRTTGLAQNTIRRALEVLRGKGLIVTAPGRGVYVR